MALSSPWRRRLLWLLSSWALAAGLWLTIQMMVGRTPITHFQASEPEVLAVRVRDAMIELERGSISTAVQRLEGLRREDPLNPMIHALLGQAWAKDPNTLPLAISSTRMAITLDPGLLTAYYNLACYRARVGEVQGAWSSLVEGINEGLTVGPDLGKDPDLTALYGDPRFQLLIQGGPATLSTSAASWEVEPARLRPGDTLTLHLKVWDLMKGTSKVDLTWLGTSSLPMLSPTKLPPTYTITPAGPGLLHHIRWQMVATRPWQGELGPFQLRLGERRVSSSAPPELQIQAGATLDLPPLDPTPFFSHIAPPPSAP